VSARELRFQRIRRFPLDCGTVLKDVRQAFYLDGELNEERDNVVVVFHALTGSADGVGDWWSEVVGPGRAIDTDRYAVLAPNLLGSCYGTTGRTVAGRERPAVTTRDQARLVGLLVGELGARSVALAAGGSLGGMVALEWLAQNRGLARSAAVFAAPAAQTAAAIGWGHVQRRAIELGGDEGLALARQIAMLTYRTGAELEARFGRRQRGDGRFEAQTYLEHHGEKLVRRFDTRSYLTLIGAMDSHDVGRGRGGVSRALHGAAGHLMGVGIPGDLLYPADDVRRWTAEAGAEYREIHSICGHDAFLTEPDQVAEILADALETGRPAAAAHAEVCA
jgi:homoserine O-acetyltransferase/O-succinyltransferase